jgi:hypothetical protein
LLSADTANYTYYRGNELQHILMFHRDVMAKLADALEGGHSGWRGVPYVRIDGDTDSRERLEVLLRNAHTSEVRNSDDLASICEMFGLQIAIALLVVLILVPRRDGMSPALTASTAAAVLSTCMDRPPLARGWTSAQPATWYLPSSRMRHGTDLHHPHSALTLTMLMVPAPPSSDSAPAVLHSNTRSCPMKNNFTLGVMT